ncbi:MAG: oligosaccharide flippase family protein [Clostridia bacterium]|nr:oligosaccharide flippase family protein [Clostridia bacterium]
MQEISYKELRRNTIIIAISNIGSKAIGFILAPLYSFYLSTAEYGTIDVITTTAGLILPFICLDIFEATFRYSQGDEYKPQIVLTSSLAICTLEIAFLLAMYYIISRFVNLSNTVFFCLISAIVDSYYHILVQFARGRGKMLFFALGGILHSILLLALNLVLMVMLRYGLEGWMVSFIAAKILVVLIMSILMKVGREIRLSAIDRKFIKEAIRYCIPLIPSAAMWWIMNASDRYVILYFIGYSATGIYAVANKLPGLLSVFENVFYQAWQTTAIRAKESENRDQVYSNVFYTYFIFLMIGVLGILVLLKPMLIHLFASDYQSAWRCASVLVVGVMVHALAGNIGTIYVVFKKTTGALSTSAIGAMSNIILNLIFVKLFGMNAAAWTTLVGYLIVFAARWIDIRQFVRLQLPLKETLIAFLFLIAQMILYYIPGYAAFGIRAVLFILFTVLHREVVFKVLKRA